MVSRKPSTTIEVFENFFLIIVLLHACNFLRTGVSRKNVCTTRGRAKSRANASVIRVNDYTGIGLLIGKRRGVGENKSPRVLSSWNNRRYYDVV